MVEVLCGLLPGSASVSEPTGRHNDGCFMAVFNVAAFRPLKEFQEGSRRVLRCYLKQPAASEGSTGVFYPGEVDISANSSAGFSGIEIEDATWEKLRSC